MANQKADTEGGAGDGYRKMLPSISVADVMASSLNVYSSLVGKQVGLVGIFSYTRHHSCMYYGQIKANSM